MYVSMSFVMVNVITDVIDEVIITKNIFTVNLAGYNSKLCNKC